MMSNKNITKLKDVSDSAMIWTHVDLMDGRANE